MQMHRGSGFFSDMLSKALPMVKNVVKNMVLPKAQEFLMSKGQEFIPSLLDKGISKLQSTKVGSYIPENLLNMARDKGSELVLSGLETGLTKASDLAKVKIGSGMRRKLTPKEMMLLEHMKYKKGSGFLSSLLSMIPVVGPVLSQLDSMGGRGMKRSGRALYPSGFM